MVRNQEGIWYKPCVTGFSNGRFVVTWLSGEGDEVRGHLFNADGSPAGDDFTVNSTNASDQRDPSITGLNDGRFVVTWQSLENGSWEVRGRVFNGDGSPADDDFTVNSTNASDQRGPGVAGLSDGRFVVTWQSVESGSASLDIRGRVFNADGSPAGDDFIVNTTTVNDQSIARIAGLSDGRFVVSWQSVESGTSPLDIRGRVFNADGTATTLSSTRRRWTNNPLPASRA